MPLVSPLVRAVLVRSSLVAAILWASCRSALAGDAAQRQNRRRNHPRGRVDSSPFPWFVPWSKRLERSETIRRQCQELAAARAMVLLQWGAFDLQSHAGRSWRSATVWLSLVWLPPIGDNIVLMAHELQHVIEQTRGLDLRAEARRVGSD